MGCSKSSSKRNVYSNTVLPQETRKTLNRHLILYLKQLEKEEPKNPKISRRKDIINIQAEISEKEMKEMIVKINNTKIWFFEKINKTDKPLARLIKKKKERRIKSTKLEMKKEKLQQTMQKYKGLLETIE